MEPTNEPVKVPEEGTAPITSTVAMAPRPMMSPYLMTGIIVALVLVAGGGIFAYEQNLNSVATPTATPTATATPDPTADWKTYNETATGVSFKYPSTWTKTITSAKAEAGDVPNPYTTQVVDLPDLGFGGTMYISTYDNIKTYADAKANLVLLQDLYTARKLTSALSTVPTVSKPFLLPEGNYAFIAATKSAYIESADGTWRGVIFGGEMGQDVSCGTNQIHNEAILTDGKGLVIQVGAGSTTSQTIACGANYNDDAHSAYIKTLSLDLANEPFVKLFTETLKPLALSVTVTKP